MTSSYIANIKAGWLTALQTKSYVFYTIWYIFGSHWFSIYDVFGDLGTIGLGNACRLFGAKPLPEPMLTYCQFDPHEQISVELKSNAKFFIHTIAFINIACKIDTILSGDRWDYNTPWTTTTAPSHHSHGPLTRHAKIAGCACAGNAGNVFPAG